MPMSNKTKVHFFLGQGGVGKTSLAALFSVNKAMQGEKVLIATFDPSLRLKDILQETERFQNEILNKNLSIRLLEPKKIFEDLIGELDQESAISIKKNKLFQKLLERINGVQEFSSLYFLNQSLKHGYNHIVIDTPPLQNALDFFESPGKLRDLFESQVVRIFTGTFKVKWFEKIFKKTRDLSLKTLQKLTGADFFNELIVFMTALDDLRPVILKTLNETEELFSDSSVKYNLVGLSDLGAVLKLKERVLLLKSKNIKIHHLFINKFIDWTDFSSKKEGLTSYINFKKKQQEVTKKIIDELMKLEDLKIFKINKQVFNKSEEQLIKTAKKIYGEN